MWVPFCREREKNALILVGFCVKTLGLGPHWLGFAQRERRKVGGPLVGFAVNSAVKKGEEN